MRAPNTFRWQQERIKKRLEIINTVLLDLDQRKITFNQVTYLARYVAEAISVIELKSYESAVGQELKVSISKPCRASSLLKNKTYRSRLDLWFRRYNDRHYQECSEISELRFKLLRLSNEHAVTLDELRSLQEINDSKKDRHVATTERNDGMTIAHMVIGYFKEFCEIHDGALVEPSPGRPVIVSADLFSTYLKWLANLF